MSEVLKKTIYQLHIVNIKRPDDPWIETYEQGVHENYLHGAFDFSNDKAFEKNAHQVLDVWNNNLRPNETPRKLVAISKKEVFEKEVITPLILKS